MDEVICDKCEKKFGNQTSLEQHTAAVHKRDEATPDPSTKSGKIMWFVGGIVVIVAAFFVFVVFGGSGDSDFSENDGIAIDFSSEKVLGNENATVTLTEYSDFQCPFCNKFFRETESLIIQQYVDTGKVKFVYKHYPVDSIHPQASRAAQASECANEQGKFWEYHDILFRNANSLGERSYKNWAQQLGLDSDQFNECYDSNRYRSVVNSDFREGRAAGVRGTPGFTINNKLISGAQPFSVFQRLIEAELAT